MRLLIVEDEPFVAADLEGLASDLGYVVVGVADCRDEAMQMAATCAPDAALVDLNLRDGLTGLDIGHAFHAGLQLPFAFVSGNIELINQTDHGAMAVVAKPFLESQIVDVLKRLAIASAEKIPWTRPDPPVEWPLAQAPSESSSDPLE